MMVLVAKRITLWLPLILWSFFADVVKWTQWLLSKQHAYNPLCIVGGFLSWKLEFLSKNIINHTHTLQMGHCKWSQMMAGCQAPKIWSRDPRHMSEHWVRVISKSIVTSNSHYEIGCKSRTTCKWRVCNKASLTCDLIFSGLTCHALPSPGWAWKRGASPIRNVSSWASDVAFWVRGRRVGVVTWESLTASKACSTGH